MFARAIDPGSPRYALENDARHSTDAETKPHCGRGRGPASPNNLPHSLFWPFGPLGPGSEPTTCRS